jgi:hypothetical protein
MARGEMVTLRVTASEKRWFQRVAEMERLTLGEWLRRLAVLRAVEVTGEPTTQTASS